MEIGQVAVVAPDRGTSQCGTIDVGVVVADSWEHPPPLTATATLPVFRVSSFFSILGNPISQHGPVPSLSPAAREDAITSLQTVVLGAKTTYFNYLLSQMLYAAALERFRKPRRNLDQAKILF